MVKDGVLRDGWTDDDLQERLLNLDEMGFDPQGNRLKITVFKGTKHPRVTTTRRRSLLRGGGGGGRRSLFEIVHARVRDS